MDYSNLFGVYPSENRTTKLSKEDFDKFQEMCNHDGQCISEQLRELIKMNIEAYEEGL